MAETLRIELFALVIMVLKTMTAFANLHEVVSIDGILAAGEGFSVDETGSLKIMEKMELQIRFLGNRVSNISAMAVTKMEGIHGSECVISDDNIKLNMPEVIDYQVVSAYVNLVFDDDEYRYICVKEIFRSSGNQNETQTRWVHQGSSPWVRFSIEPKPVKTFLLPLWIQGTLLIVLLCLSGLFSGLNLGLMALDKTELKIIEKCGSSNEKKYAKKIEPLRKRGNFLLCTLLLGNVLVNNTLTILLDDLSNGLMAVVMSTMAIVIFGEIIPQAICSRHGLAIGAHTIYLTKMFMFMTFPLSYPISLLLDKVLGEEIGQVYDKEKLQELIRMTADSKVLQNGEANIISGALQLANKVVTDVMTKTEDVYMLDINTTLDFEMMSEILKHGYTRIPVFDGDKSCIVNLLNTKDLALIDPDDNTALKTVCKFYDHRPLFVDEEYKLDSMLQDFLQGNSHMAIVQLLHNEPECDPFYEITGVVTLEDVIEEILQSEIVDETDILFDNKKKAPRRHEKRDYSVFDQNNDEDNVLRISPQLALVAFQFLSTTVEAFKEESISRNVIKRLIRQNIVVNIHPTDPPSDKNYIYKNGKECDYFVLILQGHAEAIIGKEKMTFEAGPFTYFGVDVLTNLKLSSSFGVQEYHNAKNEKYTPDFSLRAVTDMQYICIRRAHYLAARRTTYMMKTVLPDQKVRKEEETFSKEWKQALNASLSQNNSSMNIVGSNSVESGLPRTMTDEILMPPTKPRSKSELEESRSQTSADFSPKAIKELKMKSCSFDDLPPNRRSRKDSTKSDQAIINHAAKFRTSNSEMNSVKFIDEETTPLMNDSHMDSAQITPTSL